MNKKQKQHQTIVPGNAAAVNVINQDLGFALRTWKRKVKESRVLEYVKENQTYTKPSVKRKNIISKASYRQKIQDQQNKF
ncbi:MAG: 30S ribosomal protein S21 [Microbacteriaceae bacterium]|nr:30S ribosomal protein S21 [Microbacteriaceae bacterium]NBS61817.1 30S ribosomal protein S21 [Microbacteriaceae bacterium]